jgi:hypothetical protein
MCIGAACQPLTVAPTLRPQRAMYVRRRLLPAAPAMGTTGLDSFLLGDRVAAVDHDHLSGEI